jgi:chromatin assembly factor 1 subunit A
LKEREEKRKKKEEEDKAKAEQRDEKRRKKEEEQQRLQDEKDKKARQQKTLNSFFKAPGTPKKPVDVASKIESPSNEPTPSAAPKPTITPYQKLFKPFFVKDSMRMASSSRMDEATKEAKSKALDTYLVGASQQSNSVVPFKPRELFGSSATDIKRGRQHYPVKHIMEMIYKQTAGSGNAGTDETNNIIKQAKAKLATVPVKIISFSQDVRPPYYGTITYHPFALGRQHMRSLARKSVNRVLPLDYDFDSEAEWQEEDGEDVDMDDDEEELDEEDDMDGFLDDSEDAGLTRRIFANNIEPETTGICFEDTDRVGPASAAYVHRMEFMHG